MTSHVQFRRRLDVPRAIAWSIALLILIQLIGGITPAAGQTQAPAPVNQGAAPDSTNQGATPMDQINLQNPAAGQPILPEPEEKKNPFIDDSKFAIQLRTFYFYRDKFDESVSEAWAIGGSLSYKSGYLANFFAIGAVGYTSQPLYAPDDRDGTLLLAPGQDGYCVVGQLYAEFKFSERIFGAIGRKEYNTPYVNKNDTRMTPNTFEGATVYGRAGGKEGGKDGVPEVRFGGGYLTQIKERNSDSFVWMSHDAGSEAERGVALAGANVDWKQFSYGAIDYYCADVINIFYTEGKFQALKGDNYDLKFAAQFSYQSSLGDERLTGDDFSTNQWGFKGDFGIGDAVFTLAYTDTAGGDDIRNPWGGYPGYTSVQVQDFFRAGEQAVMFRAAYDFSGLGAEGLSAYALWVHGFDVNSPNDNEDEIDVNLQWTPEDGPLRGTSYRLRYAYVRSDGDSDPDIQDFRFIVNFDFPR